MRVIVNADDFGYSPATNAAIFSLICAGRLTSTTIMANAPAFQDAARRIRDLPPCSIGLHLNVTEFGSLTGSPTFHSCGIAEADLSFNGKVRGRPSLRLVDAVEREWEAQILAALEQGISISHLDSHHHVHTVPWLFGALVRIQRRYRIGKVRTTLNYYYHKEYAPASVLLLSKKVWHWSLKRLCDVTTTDYFTYFHWFMARLAAGSGGLGGAVELMCHPGQPYAANETEMLWSNWAALLPHGTDLISYHDL